MSKRASSTDIKDATESKRLRPIRCEYCRNKNHVLVDCRCKLTLCLLHLPEGEHKCDFDFRKEQEKLLSANNPAIKDKNFVRI